MPDAVVDYDLSDGKWKIIQQQNMLYERTRVLYGTGSSASSTDRSLVSKNSATLNGSLKRIDGMTSQNSMLVSITMSIPMMRDETLGYSMDMVLMVNYGTKHGAYGELLDKRWRMELKSLLDRGWVVAYADVRGGGGGGKSDIMMEDGGTNIIPSEITVLVPSFLLRRKLRAPGCFIYQLLSRSISCCNFEEARHTLLHPILPLLPVDCEEFGYPWNLEDFQAIKTYSSYDNILKDVVYPAVLVSSAFNTRFGVWQAAKWVAWARAKEIDACKSNLIPGSKMEDMEFGSPEIVHGKAQELLIRDDERK
ncbi:hypothetical protein RJ641_021427 [Dillenia turbinata]|uniref:Uncharacterized protein n=1 Tax=Dillenia turbinata TaxID=194707 RepID=A0AAN8ULP2_9MAGN